MTTERAPSPTRWWTLGAVALGTLMLMFDVSVVAIALPKIHTSLHSSFSDLQWVLDAYALTLAVALITAGSLADRHGRKRIFLAGFAVFTLSSLACGLAGSAEVLNISRGVQGIGAAVLFAVGPAMLGHEFHGKERATAFSLFGAVTGLGLALGPLLGGALTSGLSWRWIFFLNLPVGVVAIIFTALKSPESRNPNSRGTDVPGVLLLTVSLGSLVLAIIRGGPDGWTSGRILALYAVAAVAGAAFVGVELAKRDRAMFDFAFFRNPTFLGISLVAFLANAAGLPSIFIETNYLENVLGSTAWSAGLRMLPLTLALLAFGIIGGGLTGKVPFRLLMGVANLGLGVGLLLTTLATATTSWTALIPSLIFTGLGIGIFNPVRAALAIGITEPNKAGVASGINETCQQVGISLGIAVVGAFFTNRLSAAFTSSAAGRSLGAQAAHQTAVAAGAGTLPTTAGASVLTAARQAFIAGFHDSMALCAVFAFVSAIVAFLLLRSKDLHSSALSPIPPDPDEFSDAPAAEAVPVAGS